MKKKGNRKASNNTRTFPVEFVKPKRFTYGAYDRDGEFTYRATYDFDTARNNAWHEANRVGAPYAYVWNKDTQERKFPSMHHPNWRKRDGAGGKIFEKLWDRHGPSLVADRYKKIDKMFKPGGQMHKEYRKDKKYRPYEIKFLKSYLKDRAQFAGAERALSSGKKIDMDSGGLIY
jgi:hypothetical protein